MIIRPLLARAEAFAREHGIDQMRLYTSVKMTKNQSIYRHLGCREDGRRIEQEFQRVYFCKALSCEPWPRPPESA